MVDDLHMMTTRVAVAQMKIIIMYAKMRWLSRLQLYGMGMAENLMSMLSM